MTGEGDAAGACLSPETLRTALSAGLRYYPDCFPGIHRERRGRGFVYFDPEGALIRNRAEIRRLRGLAVPPAWTGVWISPYPEGHLQATGRDARGRKQYRYHARWRDHQSRTKYDRMLDFADVLPDLRRRVSMDLMRYGLPREKVLALVVRLLEITLIRVGNREYVRENESFGLTTLLDEHVEIRGERIEFRFRGKSGKEHRIDVRDRRLARVVRRSRDIPGQELFRYLDEAGASRGIESGDVNDYLRAVTEREITAKDFRTWGGTVRVVLRLGELGPGESDHHTDRNVAEAVREAARFLGNRPETCRKYYVHPAVVEAYRAGTLLDILRRETERTAGRDPFELDAGEMTVVAVLRESGDSDEDGGV